MRERFPVKVVEHVSYQRCVCENERVSTICESFRYGSRVPCVTCQKRPRRKKEKFPNFFDKDSSFDTRCSRCGHCADCHHYRYPDLATMSRDILGVKMIQSMKRAEELDDLQREMFGDKSR